MAGSNGFAISPSRADDGVTRLLSNSHQPWRGGVAANNWSLSAGRAEATRQALVLGGVPQGRFARIEGVAATEPLIGDNPADPRNRRISLLLLEGRGAASGGPGANAPPGTDQAVPKP